MRKILLILTMLALIPFAIGQDTNETNTCEELSDVAGYLAGKEVPSFLPYKNEQINVYSISDIYLGSVETVSGVAQNVSCNAFDNPSVTVYVSDLDLIELIAQGDDPIKEFRKQLGDNIIFQPHSFGGTIKFFGARIALYIFSFF